MATEQHIDDGRRRVTIRLTGIIRGQPFTEMMVRLFDSRPEVTGYDFLYDLLAYEGEIVAADVEPMAVAYLRNARAQAMPARTCFVTTDPFFVHWTAALDHQFPGRTHHVVVTMAAGERCLAQPRR